MSAGRWASLIGVLVLGLLAWWWWSTFERVEVTLPAPLTGEARSNPYFGLARTLERGGHPVQRAVTLGDAPDLPARGLLLLGSDLRGLRPVQVDALMDWVADGGMLVAGLPQGMVLRQPPLLRELGLEVVEARGCIQWNYAAPEAATEILDAAREPLGEFAELREMFEAGLFSGTGRDRFCGNARVQARDGWHGVGPEWGWGNAEDGLLLARFAHGEGRIVLASHLDFLRTTHLRHPANAALAGHLVLPLLEEGAAVLIVHHTDYPPLHVLLVREGWPVLLPLLLALLGWLWLRGQRFGPVLAPEARPRRALREHLRAAAELVLRRGRGADLLAPLRERCYQQLVAADPALAGLSTQELVRLLAQRHRLPPEAIERALFDTWIRRPSELAAAVKTLRRLSHRP